MFHHQNTGWGGGGGGGIKITYKCCEDVPKVLISGDVCVKNYTNGQIQNVTTCLQMLLPLSSEYSAFHLLP